MRKPIIRTLGFLCLCAVLWLATVDVSAHPWSGVDDTVVGKFAKEANRPPSKPLIDTTQGDLGLFVFLLAGLAGGFVGGYYFRELFPPKHRGTDGSSSV